MSKTYPQPKHLDDAFEQINAELLRMFIKKHRDYGKGNILAVKELGIALRITEKVERLKNLLISQKEPDNESVEETWIDIAVYAVVAILYRRGWFEALDLSEKERVEE